MMTWILLIVFFPVFYCLVMGFFTSFSYPLKLDTEDKVGLIVISILCFFLECGAFLGLYFHLNLKYDTAIIDAMYAEPIITLYREDSTTILDAEEYEKKHFEGLHAWYGMPKEDAISAYKEIGADIKDNGEGKEFSYSGQLYALEIDDGKTMLYYDELKIVRKIVIKKQ